MANLLRPLKAGGTRQFQTEYNLGYRSARDSEVDADLDTIYSAWNAGVPHVVQRIMANGIGATSTTSTPAIFASTSITVGAGHTIQCISSLTIILGTSIGATVNRYRVALFRGAAEIDARNFIISTSPAAFPMADINFIETNVPAGTYVYAIKGWIVSGTNGSITCDTTSPGVARFTEVLV